jgi:uncharacterized membrane protein YdjX (TVP38/TMEM64 family)
MERLFDLLAIAPATLLALLVGANIALMAARLLHRDDAAARISRALAWSSRYLGLGERRGA